MLDRSFVLFGLGLSYDYDSGNEFYANISENYRSVTFNDIRTVNPTFIIDPDIKDESGFTVDMGYRGKWNDILSFDVSTFLLNYSDRIGTVLVQSGPNKGDRVRKNIGNAFIYGLESFIDWNAVKTFGWDASSFILNPFINLALTDSRYYQSEETNVTGHKVEFIPFVNLKTGVRFGYKNFLGSLQFTHLSSQYTDAQNSGKAEPGDSREGIIGPIPAYSLLDLSLSYRFRQFKIESGINNLLNEKYFGRRATGYPGPGIIPGDPRSYYVTLEIKLF
jgi:Fe(3+) dicitrate transport protein